MSLNLKVVRASRLRCPLLGFRSEPEIKIVRVDYVTAEVTDCMSLATMWQACSLINEINFRLNVRITVASVGDPHLYRHYLSFRSHDLQFVQKLHLDFALVQPRGVLATEYSAQVHIVHLLQRNTSCLHQPHFQGHRGANEYIQKKDALCCSLD